VKFDWQTIAVAFVVACATFYVARRAFARLRSFRAGAKADASCATGCGKCGGEPIASRPVKTLIQINPSKRTPKSERGTLN
jgi:hypothetical protein